MGILLPGDLPLPDARRIEGFEPLIQIKVSKSAPVYTIFKH
jgi:hypothetical protein